MAIRDLLWACPECSTDGSLEPAGRRLEACRACGTRYRRGRGATIVAMHSNGTRVERNASEWIEHLPALVIPPSDGPHDAHYRRDRVELRLARRDEPVHWRGRFLGRIERLEPRHPGVLTLGRDRLHFAGDEGRDRVWLLASLTGVQASSSTLQVKAYGARVASFRFPDASVRLWEMLLHTALRRLYHAHGRGDIVEFQPRIVTR